MASFQAAGTSYATHGLPVIPFYIFYSMFGFQRTGDQMWAFGDARGRGFLMGATAGRTTLTGEGLQHDDGHSQILSSTVPERPRLRPGLRLRAGGGHPRRHRADVRPEARGRLLLRHDLQRELRPAAATRGHHRRADPARRLPLCRGARISGATRTRPGWSARARSSARSSPRATCSPRSSASPPRSTARRRSRCSDAMRSRPNAGTGSTRGEEGARPLRQHDPAARRRTDRRRVRLDEGAPGHGLALAATALPGPRDRRLRPERHAREPALAVRDRPAAHRRGDARRARPLRGDAGRDGRARRSATSGSIRRRRTRSPSEPWHRRAPSRRSSRD